MLVRELVNYYDLLKKVLYGLKQALWYERHSNFHCENDFVKSKIGYDLFLKVKDNEMLLVQIYVDDIILSATNESLCEYFSNMQKEIEMSMIS